MFMVVTGFHTLHQRYRCSYTYTVHTMKACRRTLALHGVNASGSKTVNVVCAVCTYSALGKHLLSSINDTTTSWTSLASRGLNSSCINHCCPGRFTKKTMVHFITDSWIDFYKLQIILVYTPVIMSPIKML